MIQYPTTGSRHVIRVDVFVLFVRTRLEGKMAFLVMFVVIILLLPLVIDLFLLIVHPLAKLMLARFLHMLDKSI